MNALELLSAVEPLLQRAQGQLTVSRGGLRELTRRILADHTTPELYQLVKPILVVITAVGEMSGGESAAAQLQAELLEDVVARIGQDARVDLARRRARPREGQLRPAIAQPAATGVRSRSHSTNKR